MNLILVLPILTGCVKSLDDFSSRRGIQHCGPLISLDDFIVFGEYELEMVWPGWDIWIGDEIKNEALIGSKIQCFIQNKSQVPIRIFWYPGKRKWLQPNEQFEWYTGFMYDLVRGQGVDRKHFNIWAEQEVKVIKFFNILNLWARQERKTVQFSIKIKFESNPNQLHIEIPVVATYSD